MGGADFRPVLLRLQPIGLELAVQLPKFFDRALKHFVAADERFLRFRFLFRAGLQALVPRKSSNDKVWS